MTRAHLLLLVGGAGLLLAGCGSATGSAPAVPAPTASAVSLSVDPATCTAAKSSSDCTVRVWYTNVSAANVDVDPTSTRLLDQSGAAYLPTAVGDVSSGVLVRPGERLSVTWRLTLPSGSDLSAVTWLGGDGTSQTAPLALAATGSSPSPTPAPPTPTPKPTPKPKPKPAATPKPKPTATRTTSSGSGGSQSGGQSGGGGSGGGASSPPVGGTIG